MIIEDEGPNKDPQDHRSNNSLFEEKIQLILPIFNADGGSNDRGFKNSKRKMEFSDDMLYLIFSLLEHIDLCGAAMVCKQWRATSAHEDFWRSLKFESNKISLKQYEEMCRRYPNATEVKFKQFSFMNSIVMKPVLSLRHLERLTVQNGQICNMFFNLLKSIDSLRNLTLKTALLGSETSDYEELEDIVIDHDTMRHLHIERCELLNISISCPQLETLYLKRSGVIRAQVSCPLLVDLSFAFCECLSNESIRSAATSSPLLESLEVSNEIDDGILREIGSICRRLRILSIYNCYSVALAMVRLPMLTFLKLQNCVAISSTSMTALAYSPMLEVLHIEDCNFLTLELVLAHLKTIQLVHCSRLSELNLSTLKLTSITVSNCPSLYTITLTSNLLQKLVLEKLEGLTTLILQCKCLQEVELRDCEILKNNICEAFNDGGGCPMLRSLAIDNCEGLTTFVLYNTSLISLSLVGCIGITSLKLICPQLEKISLDGCENIEIASFCPVGLESLNLGICQKLSVLHIEAPSMLVLELKECGVLSKASINCPILNSLDTSFCRKLMDDVISVKTSSYPLIETLILMACPSISPDEFSSMCQLSHLTSLDLSYTFVENLHRVFDSCLQLKVLKLQACKYLSDASLEPLFRNGACPSLCELDLSYGTYSQSTIDGLLAYCTQLTHLSLNGCVNIHDLIWGFKIPCFGSQLSVQQPNHMLQNLKCVGCPNIKEVRIPAAAAACCFNLLSLNLSLSHNLKVVDLVCPNLRCLNLSNCYSLKVLKLDCPKLVKLSLQWSNIDEETLISAISECKLLKMLDIRFCPKIYFVNGERLQTACPGLKCVFSCPSSSLLKKNI